MRAAHPVVAAVICAWTIASSLEAATLVELERALVDAVTVRARTAASRDQRVAEASALADEIARLKTRAGDTARADALLESRLRQLDRLSTALDQIDARLREQDGLLGQLRAAFDVEADAESRRVTEDRRVDPRVVASRLSEVDDRRRRVEQLTRVAPDFRPVLDIRATPADTVADIDRKRAILGAERQRASSELGRLARELSVLDARETLKRRLLETLESALNEAPAEMRVLRRQTDDLTQSLRDLNRQRQDLHTFRRVVEQALMQLDQRQGELQARRRAITGRVPTGDAE